MRTIFVGDVHGCAAEFEAFLEKVDYDFTQDRLLLTGDAFARGPDPLAVWQLICDTEAEMVLGNHDARLLKQLTALKKGRKPKVKFPDQRYTLAQLQPAHGEILAWLRQCPLYIAEDASCWSTPASIRKRAYKAPAAKNSSRSALGLPPTISPARAGTISTSRSIPWLSLATTRPAAWWSKSVLAVPIFSASTRAVSTVASSVVMCLKKRGWCKWRASKWRMCGSGWLRRDCRRLACKFEVVFQNYMII